MNKLAQYLRDREMKDTEKRFKHYYNTVYGREDWSLNLMTLEELDNIPVTSTGKVQDDIETAVRMGKLADAYWNLYCKHYGSEGQNRGQQLQQRSYDILCQHIGPWHAISKIYLTNLCRWDIDNTDQKRILDNVLAHLKQQNADYTPTLLEKEVVLCCLRNEDYSDSVKALAELCCIRRKFEVFGELLFAIHLGRQEWDEAEYLLQDFESSFEYYRPLTEMYADLGEVQIRHGRLVDGEATLLNGAAAERTRVGTGYISCNERLMDLYVQQKRWNDAEKLGILLMLGRGSTMSRIAAFEVRQKATRVIKINRWRRFAWDDDAKVYFLHQLYNTARQLAFVYLELKQYDKAQQLLEELLRDKMHRENPILVASKELLVTVYMELRECERGEKLQEKIVEEMTWRFGYDSEQLIPELKRLANIYQKNNHLGKRHHVKLRLLRYR